MSEKELFELKNRLVDHCRNLLDGRINQSLEQMQNLQEAANNEEKSSAGDKYETSRAMNQISKDMFAQNLQENQQELSMFLSILQQKRGELVRPGHLVYCGTVLFFITVGLVKLIFEGRIVLVVSSTAPVAQQILGKKKGESIRFNNQDLQILAIS